MIMPIDKIREEIEALAEERKRRLREEEQAQRVAFEAVKAIDAEINAAIEAGKDEKTLFDLKRRKDIAILRQNHAKTKYLAAKEKELPTEEDGREILRRIEEAREKMFADSLAEIWQGFLLIERAADKYGELARKCNETLYFYNDNVAPILIPIGSRDGKPVYKERWQLKKADEINIQRMKMRDRGLYYLAKKEAEKRGLDMPAAEPEIRKNWV